MLSKADELPIHQTPEPIAYSGTDRNFYDRSFFAGYTPDGSILFEVAFGVYPHLNLADAHVSVLIGGHHHALHASRHLDMERMDMRVGPIRIEIVEHLKTLRVLVEEHDGIAADVTFTGRAFPLQEPRFTWRIGPRTFWDYTRFSQNGHWTGWVSVDGIRHELPAGSCGTRDRSWGVRNIGATDPQPWVPEKPQQFFWCWAPVNFASRSTYFHRQAEADGTPVNVRGVLCPDDASAAEMVEVSEPALILDFGTENRWPNGATIDYAPAGAPGVQLRFEPLARFLMASIGYPWTHGSYKGELVVERGDLTWSEADPTDPAHLHTHVLSKVTRTDEGGGTEVGIGLLETLVLGPYAPMGFTDAVGPSTR